MIPKAVDEYLTFLEKFPSQPPAEQLENPVWHIHGGHPPADGSPVSFALMLNLVSAANAETKDVLWGFLARYAPGATPDSHPMLDHLAGYALAYYEDFVKPAKAFRAPSAQEAAALGDLAARLRAYGGEATDAEALQTLVFAVGKDHGFEPLRDWFTALYETLLGQSQGPRFGGFIALYGVQETAALIDGALARQATT